MNKRISSSGKGLSMKDLIITGVFTAIYFVFSMIGGIFFAPNPVLTFYMPLGIALLCGPVYMLLIAKVQKRWSIAILGIIVGVIWFGAGMHWALSVGYIVMGIIADLVAGLGNYKSKMYNLISYMLLSLGSAFTYILYFIDPKGWIGTMLKNGTEQSYLDAMQEAAPPWLLLVIVAGTIAAAALSGWLGNKMLKKQFERAGITA